MQRQTHRVWARNYLFAVLLLWILVAAWALTKATPGDGIGAYIVNENNELVPAVRGGLGMMLRGGASLDADLLSVGWNGFFSGLFSTVPGIALLVLAGVSALSWIPIRARIKKQTGVQ